MEELKGQQKHVFNQLMESKPDRDVEEAKAIVRAYVSDTAKFEVTDLSSANWVLKQLAECDVDEEAIIAMYEDEHRALEERMAALLKPIERKREFFTAAYGGQLEEFAKSELKGKKKRSVDVIYGRFGFRKQPDKLVITDHVQAAKAAEVVAPDVLDKRLNLTRAKQFIDDGGELPFCKIEHGEDAFFIRSQSLEEVK